MNLLLPVILGPTGVGKTDTLTQGRSGPLTRPIFSLPVILGPTGVGKTKIAIEVASKIGEVQPQAEIVSCDSRQVYRYMDIGTSKPTQEELSKVKHWLIDIVPPDVTLNAWEYAKLARKKIKEILRRGKIALVVGGSGLYLRALIDGFFRVKEMGRDRSPDLSASKRIKERLRADLTSSLYKKLAKVDPVTAHNLHSNDRMRIIRALEVYELTGIPISVLKKSRVPFNCHPIYIGLTMPRALLYNRIEERVDQMMHAGFLEEVKILLQTYSSELNSFQTIGYKELISHIQGKITLDEAIRLIKRNTRRYAKRQLTWFKSIKGIHWIELPAPCSASRFIGTPQIIKKCINLINLKKC